MRSVFFNKIVKETMNNKSVGCGEAAFQITITRKQDKKPKRIRSAFTTDQIKFLEDKYKKHPYIDNVDRKEVSKTLNITERSVKIWFQNRRMREKHYNKDLDFNKLRNSPNGRLTNSPSSTNNTPLPLVMTSNIESNEKHTDKNISVKTGSINNSKKESKHVYEKINGDKLKNTVKTVNSAAVKTATKHPFYSNSEAFNAHVSRAPLSSTQVRTKSSSIGQTKSSSTQYNYDSVPKTVCPNRYYHPGYVGRTAIWRPVEMVPVVPKKTVPVLNTVKRTRPVCCKCNCHNSKRNASMMKMVQQKPMYSFPYPPLMFTAVPFQNPM